MSCLFVHRGHFLKLIKLQQFHFWHLQLTFEKQGNQILNKGKLSSWQTLIFKIQQFSEKFAWNYCVSHPLQFCFGNKAWAECLKITQKVSFYNIASAASNLNFPIVISATIYNMRSFLLVSNSVIEYYSFEDMIVEKFLSGGLGNFDWLMILKISL